MTEPITIPVYKMGMVFRLSLEQTAIEEGFKRRGHDEPVTPTAEQIAQHARAQEIIGEVESNPYVYIGGYDWELSVESLETKRWVFDETHTEWMDRYREGKANQ